MGSQFKAWSDGDVLTAADLNGYLMKQAVIVCDTSADYPASPVEGMLVYDKALDCYLGRTASAWVRLSPLTNSAVQTWSPAMTQSASITGFSVNEARYYRQGGLVHAWCNINGAGSSSGTIGNALTVSLPVTASGHGTLTSIGGGNITLDTNVLGSPVKFQWLVDVVVNSGGSTVSFRSDMHTSGDQSIGRWGVEPNVGWMYDYDLSFSVTYVV